MPPKNGPNKFPTIHSAYPSTLIVLVNLFGAITTSSSNKHFGKEQHPPPPMFPLTFIAAIFSSIHFQPNFYSFALKVLIQHYWSEY